MKVALVYDRVNKWGGAERVLLVLHEIFPTASLYTSVYNPKTALWARVFPKITTSFLQKIPFAKTKHNLLAPLMPFAFESFNFSEFDLVISVTSESAKAVITSPKTKHICLMLTPTRYLWSGYEEYFRYPLLRIISWPLVKILQKWDIAAANRPDIIISISDEVSQRVKKYYGQESKIIYPPVDIQKFQSKTLKFKMAMKGLPSGDYYLIVSRLVPYKKVDVAIYAFNNLKLPLVVVGTGSELRKLKSIAQKNIIFAGQISDDDLSKYYTHCKALIFPQEEDFGIVAIEAQSAGKPVIAYKKGGALETVIEDRTGIFFEEQKPEDIINAVKRFQKIKFSARDCQDNAKNFSKEKFKANILQLVKNI